MSNVNVQLQDENGNNTFPYTYTNNVFDKNGNPINDRLLYGTREAITILPPVTTPASQNMITEQYDTTKTYPTYSKYCIYNNQLYKYSGASGTTTTGTFDNTKWTATNVIDSIDWNTLNNKPSNIAYAGPALATENVPAIDAYLHKSDVVDNFTDGGTDVPLSAECGKLLNSTLTTKTKYEILYYNSITSDLNVTITQSIGETWVRRFGSYVDFRVAVKLNEAYSAWDANRSIIKLPFSNPAYMVTTFFVNNIPVKGAYLTPTNACGVQLGTNYASGTTLTIEGHFIFSN